MLQKEKLQQEWLKTPKRVAKDSKTGKMTKKLKLKLMNVPTMLMMMMWVRTLIVFSVGKFGIRLHNEDG